MPEIQEVLDSRFTDENLEAFGISIGDPLDELRDFRAQEGVTFPFLLLNPTLPNPYYQALVDLWELPVFYPTFVILDTNGIIRFRASGLEGPDDDEIDLNKAFDLIDTLLQEAKEQGD